MNKEKKLAPVSFKQGIGQFGRIAITLSVIYFIIRWGIPFLTRKVTAMDFPFPVPGTLMIFYIVLILIVSFIYLTSSEKRLQEFLFPIKRLLKGEYGEKTRLITMTAIPLIFGFSIYNFTAPKVSSPTALRLQHPSSNFPKEMETLKNPLRNPADADVDKFIEEVKANHVEFIPQVNGDVESWKGKNPDKHILEFFPTEPVQTLLKELKGGNISRERGRAALIEKYLFEGRALFAMNCRPCHGDSTAGDGPMADGFKLRPINFTDTGTIDTIVEGYTFWRVTEGGRGLPVEATPWDSVMPTWKTDLPEEYRWRIILAEYDLAQKGPREPEKVEEKEY